MQSIVYVKMKKELIKIKQLINMINNSDELSIDDLMTHMRESHIISPYLLDMVINYSLAIKRKLCTQMRVLI